MFTARNAVLLAITQTAVIVIGTLAAAVSGKFWKTSGIEIPFITFVLVNFGILLFAFPMGWISVAMAIRQKESISDDLKYLTFLIGLGLLVGLIFFECYAVFKPWVSVLQMPVARQESE